MVREQAIGVNIAKTLHELPVAKDVRHAAMNIIAHILVGVRNPWQVLTIQSDVPHAAHILPIPQASMSIIRTSIMLVHPSINVLTAFLKLKTLVAIPMIIAVIEARINAVSRAFRELPLARDPRIPFVLISPV